MQSDTPAQLPPLGRPDQDALLLFLSLRQDPVATATNAKLHYAEILEWSSRPDIAAYIDQHRSLRANLFRDAALEHLDHIMRTTRDETIRCRAAIGIIRATDPARFKTRAAKRATARTAHTKNNAGAAPPPHQMTHHNGHIAATTAPDEPAPNEPAAQAREKQSDPAAPEDPENPENPDDHPSGPHPGPRHDPESDGDTALDHDQTGHDLDNDEDLNDDLDLDEDLDDDQDLDDDWDDDDEDWEDDDPGDEDPGDEDTDDDDLLSATVPLTSPDRHSVKPPTPASPGAPDAIPRAALNSMALSSKRLSPHRAHIPSADDRSVHR